MIKTIITAYAVFAALVCYSCLRASAIADRYYAEKARTDDPEAKAGDSEH